MADRVPHFGLVAGEASGDQLGEGLIYELKARYPGARFSGIGGEKMIAQGMESLFPLERLSVMGFVEPLKRLPELISIRRQLYRHFVEQQVDVFIGIDAPDFNLGLEKKLRKQCIRTTHYVSPSVWAWRHGRIKKIRKAVDLMLCLLPFEQAFYEQHGVEAICVGHPLADSFLDQPDTTGARKALGLIQHAPVLTIMPGSRGSEIAMLGELFLQVAAQCRETLPDLQLVIPAANSARREQLQTLLGQFPNLPVTLLDKQSHRAMEAADVVLLASGTTALEAMLLKKPMVVSYRMGKWSYKLAERLVKVKHISLPNLLAGDGMVPELIQDQATVENLTAAVLAQFDPARSAMLNDRFSELHRLLQRGGSAAAADAIGELLGRPC